MLRVNLLKQIKADGVWALRSIPRKVNYGLRWEYHPAFFD